MNKQKIYDQLQRTLEDRRMEARIACWIGNKIEPLLPEHWKMEFENWGRLSISRSTCDGSGHPVEEFKLICKLIESATDQKPKKEIWESNGSITALTATAHFPMADYHNLHIDIRLYDTEECKVNIKKKIIDQAELLDDCLGIN